MCIRDRYLLDISGEWLKIDLPCNISAEINQEIVIKKKLPVEIQNNIMIALYTYTQSLKVCIGNSENIIYTYDTRSKQVFGKSTASGWNYINIPQEYSGEEIILTFLSPYNMSSGKIGSVYYGERAELQANIINLSLIHI